MSPAITGNPAIGEYEPQAETVFLPLTQEGKKIGLGITGDILDILCGIYMVSHNVIMSQGIGQCLGPHIIWWLVFAGCSDSHHIGGFPFLSFFIFNWVMKAEIKSKKGI